MNSKRLRSAIDAPNEAITTMIDWPLARSRANSSQSSTSASSAVSAIATIKAAIRGRPNDSGLIAVEPPNAPTTTSAA